MRIPEEIVEQILRQSDIVEIVGEVVNLKKRGKNYVGLCPFHNEKTPSFNVLPEKGLYKCFGCGKGGNSAIFLRDYHKLSYGEALKDLAKRANIPLPDEQSPEQNAEFNRLEQTFTALRAAGNYFYQLLTSESGKIALNYLQNRGFSEETIKQFGLGYSPDSFDATNKELHLQGFSEETLIDAGLLVVHEDSGKKYDRFRGRLMFPIQNPLGRVVGFGARRLQDEPSTPKYINSPQSLVYDKSSVLYGLFQAKDAIRQNNYAILVEGYADALSVYQGGFKNVIASSGTALTKEQLKLLQRFCKRLKIVYDADTAGINAAQRGLDLAVEEGFDVEIVTLPEGDDPDSLLQREGAESFQWYLDHAESLVVYKISIAKKQGLLETPSGQTNVVRDVLETIAKVPDQFQRDFMIRDVALRFHLSEQDLYREIQGMLRKLQISKIDELQRSQIKYRPPINELPALPEAGQQGLETVSLLSVSESSGAEDAGLFPEEREILRIILTTRGAYGYVTRKLGLSDAHLHSATAQRLFLFVQDASEHNDKPLEWLLASKSLPESDIKLLTGIAIPKETISQRWKEFNIEFPSSEHIEAKILLDCTKQLKIRWLERELLMISEQLQHPPDEAVAAFVPLDLLREHQRLDNERRKLLDELSGVLPM